MTKDLRWYDGAFYHVERLALWAYISKATIDYYTNLEFYKINSCEF